MVGYEIKKDDYKGRIIWEYVDKLDPLSKLFLLTDMMAIKTLYMISIKTGAKHPEKNLKGGQLDRLIRELSTTEHSTREADIYKSPVDDEQQTIYPQSDESGNVLGLLPKLRQNNKARKLISWVVEKIDFEPTLNQLRASFGLQGEPPALEAHEEAQGLEPQYSERFPLLEAQEAVVPMT
ncbi:hypothetical protein RF11_06666 [Thelohanellus kitauei]|uniref:Uncharacterized protein n=1 Tax=Thelohanellus kitauei TaxID=669202 RepID=A0A0C2MPT1_THEKT|nr:hypothetical protein RF11_06666 [Thelohanellus kitauei]